MKTTELPVIFTGEAPGKSDILEQSQNIIDSILKNGDVNPLKVATSIKALELAIKTIKDGIDEYILEEAEKSGKSFEFDGHNISIREMGVRYDYSLCCDPEYNELKEKQSEINEKIKSREKFLQAITDEQTIVYKFSGEVATLLPPSKTSKTGIAITLKK